MVKEENNIIWRLVPYTKGFYQVSNYGSVRTVSKENMMFNINSVFTTLYTPVMVGNKMRVYDKYSINIPCIHIKTKSANFVRPLSTVVYASFHGIDNLSIDEIFHIDGNEQNNNIDNLILCEQLTKKRIIEQFYDKNAERIISDSLVDLSGMKFITEYSMNGIKQNLHTNIASVARVIDFPFSRVKNVLSAKKMLSHSNKIFKKGNGPYSIDTSLIVNNNMCLSNSARTLYNRFILQYDTKGLLVRIYTNLYEVCMQNHFSYSAIENAIINRSIFEGFLWIAE